VANITLLSSEIPNLLPSRDRSPGLHHSDVLSDLCVSLGHYPKSELSMSRLQLGLAFEDVIADRYARHDPGRYFRPGEMDIDGLPITLDLFDCKRNGPDELKLTWMSSAHPPTSEKFLRYRWQVMSQCIASHSNRGRRHVGHINGDYKNFAVDYRVWEEVFSAQELDDHRTMILRHRDRMLREGWTPERNHE
jgi:hypothetical protein